MVGSDARMRVSSPMTPFLSGTLKSTRTNTRRPFSARSRMVRFAMRLAETRYSPRAAILRSRSTQRLA